MESPPNEAGWIAADAMREALSDRMSAWAELAQYRMPIGKLSPEVRQKVDMESARFRAAKSTLVAGLWQRCGRWTSPANDVDLILDAEGDGYLMLAPWVMRPEVARLQAAEMANARRFGSPGAAPSRRVG